METVGSSEARTNLPTLLGRVAKGESFRITRYGAPIAILVLVAAEGGPDAKQVIAEIKKLRGGRTLGGITIRELTEKGRRY